MATEFKTGDCVELKYGGGDIKMTVEEVDNFSEGYRALCTWYDKTTKKFEKQLFIPDTLKPCETSTPDAIYKG
jgi:uncharacterized protein YodC (DUF2158 family)